MIRLLADEHIPVASIRAVREVGYDLVAVTEFARGADDATVLQMAHEEHRILLTFDAQELGKPAASMRARACSQYPLDGARPAGRPLCE